MIFFLFLFLLLFLGRRTEEGFVIYKEDELGIHDTGGGRSFLPLTFRGVF